MIEKINNLIDKADELRHEILDEIQTKSAEMYEKTGDRDFTKKELIKINKLDDQIDALENIDFPYIDEVDERAK